MPFDGNMPRCKEPGCAWPACRAGYCRWHAVLHFGSAAQLAQPRGKVWIDRDMPPDVRGVSPRALARDALGFERNMGWDRFVVLASERERRGAKASPPS